MRVRSITLQFVGGLLVTIGVMAGGVAAESSHGESELSNPLLKALAANATRKRFGGIGRYSSQFRLLCKELGRDGRREEIALLIAPHVTKDPACRACKDFFKVFHRSCKASSRRRVRRGEQAEQEQVITKQLEPRLGVVSVGASLFAAMASDQRVRFDLLPAVDRFETVIASEAKSTGLRGYLEILYAYIGAPFKALREEIEEAQSRDETPHSVGAFERERESLDSLFEDSW